MTIQKTYQLGEGEGEGEGDGDDDGDGEGDVEIDESLKKNKHQDHIVRKNCISITL